MINGECVIASESEPKIDQSFFSFFTCTNFKRTIIHM